MKRGLEAIAKPVLGGVLIALIGFIGGQVAPQVVPPSWSLGAQRLDFNDLNTTYKLLKSQFDGTIDTGKVMDGARAGLVSAAGDPYTVYMDAAAAKALNNQLSGTLSGIGAEVGIKNNQLTVIAPIAGSPAAKAGLQAGDIIVGIDHTDSSQFTLDAAVAKIRGPKDSKATLTVERGSASPQDITITRDVITVPSVTSSMKPGTIGYIKISEFGNDTSSKIVQAAGDLKNQGAKSVILDLRDNPGGYLDAAVTVTGQFAPDNAEVVDERHGGQSMQKLYTKGAGPLAGVPVVVLINGGSASASEIVAGALRDDIHAQLVGQKSFGKGSVQQINELAGGAELKVTVAHWFTPSGQGIDHIGITPTTKVDMTKADIDAGTDPQLAKAMQLLGQ